MSQHSPPQFFFFLRLAQQIIRMSRQRERTRLHTLIVPPKRSPQGIMSQSIEQTFVCCVALGHLELFNIELCCFVQPKSNVKSIGLWAACHISKDLKHKALYESEKSVAEISTLDTRTSAYSYIFEQASVSHTCQWHGFHYKYMVVLMTTESISFVSLHDGVKKSLSCELLVIGTCYKR